MKRMICLLLIMLLSFSGCSLLPEDLQSPVTFYYLRTELAYGQDDGLIAGEEVDAGTHREDIEYLLGLYLNGPTKDQLKSPFPKNVELVAADYSKDTMEVILKGSYVTMEALDISKMCVCLGKTCFGFSDAEKLTLRLRDPKGAGEKIIQLTRDDLALLDQAG